MVPKPKPRRKPPVKPELGRGNRNLVAERQWEATGRKPRAKLTIYPSPVQMSWLVQQAEDDETPGKTASRILFSGIDH